MIVVHMVSCVQAATCLSLVAVVLTLLWPSVLSDASHLQRKVLDKKTNVKTMQMQKVTVN